MKDKKTILKAIICIAIIVLCTVVSVKTIIKSKGEDNNKGNGNNTNQQEIFKDSTVGDISISSIKVNANDETSNYRAIVSNKSDQEYHIETLTIAITTDGYTQKIPALNNITLKANESKVINITFDYDITKATKIEYIIK